MVIANGAAIDAAIDARERNTQRSSASRRSKHFGGPQCVRKAARQLFVYAGTPVPRQ